MLNNSLSLWPSLADLFDRYDKMYKNLGPALFTKHVDFSSPDNIGFEETEDNTYVMCLELNKKATKDNVTIDIDCGEMTVKYCYSDDTTTTKNEIVMTLPEDLDVNSMTAKVSAGVLTITADKIVKAEPVEVEDDDEFEIEINLN